MIQKLSPDQIAKIISAKSCEIRSNHPVSQVSIDSRKIFFGKETIFIALKGTHHDGHEFIEQCYEQGVRHFIVHENKFADFNDLAFPEANIYGVKDTLLALQQLAGWNRSLFRGPLLGIAGSNGKTIIKEWLGQLLSMYYQTAKSPKSFNSQIGVPLSLFSIAAYHQAAIIEAGISEPGEMQALEAMIKPSIGLLTNIGSAHDKNFHSRIQKLEEKIKLFTSCQLIIYRKDQTKVAEVLAKNFAPERLVSWSDHSEADYILQVKKDVDRCRIILFRPDLSMFTFTTPFTDEASLENLRHVIVAALTLGLSFQQIQDGISQLSPIDMRLTVKEGLRQCTLIDDTYNNDLGGLEVALDFMETQRQKKHRKLILSDFPQLKNQKEVYQRVSQLVDHYGIDQLIGIGTNIQKELAHLKPRAVFFKDTEEFIQSQVLQQFEQDLVLIKGGRSFAFERIVHALEEKVHGTVLEINLNALSHNFFFYRGQLPQHIKIMAMVKAAAYGGGAAEIANHLQKLKADYLSVAYPDEGAELRRKGITLPIMVLNAGPENVEQLLLNELEPVVYSVRMMEIYGAYCKSAGKKLNIHLDIDSGMRRLGFDYEDLDQLKKLIAEYPKLTIKSIFTHLSGTSDPNHDAFSHKQLGDFESISNEIMTGLPYSPIRHALNTAGILRFPDHAFDMVRLGIGLYGISVEEKSLGQLRQVGTLKTTVSQIKRLKKGESVGYDRKGIMPTDGQIATIALGYADGFDRRFSNGNGYVLINGQKAPVIGNVCMDMTMVNITGIPVKEGDPVVVYGEGIDLHKLAESIGTIPYELLTNISSRVKRTYYLD